MHDILVFFSVMWAKTIEIINLCSGILPELFYFFAFYSEKGRISKSIAELQAGKAVIL